MYTAEKYGLDMAKRIDNGMSIEKASFIAIWELAEDIEEDFDKEGIGYMPNENVNFSTLMLKANWKWLTQAFKEARGIDVDPELVERYFPSDEFTCISEEDLYSKWRDSIVSIYNQAEAEIEAEIEAMSPLKDMSLDDLIAFDMFLQQTGQM